MTKIIGNVNAKRLQRWIDENMPNRANFHKTPSGTIHVAWLDLDKHVWFIGEVATLRDAAKLIGAIS